MTMTGIDDKWALGQVCVGSWRLGVCQPLTSLWRVRQYKPRSGGETSQAVIESSEPVSEYSYHAGSSRAYLCFFPDSIFLYLQFSILPIITVTKSWGRVEGWRFDFRLGLDRDRQKGWHLELGRQCQVRIGIGSKRDRECRNREKQGTLESSLIMMAWLHLSALIRVLSEQCFENLGNVLRTLKKYVLSSYYF